MALTEVPLPPFYTLVTVITVNFYFIYKDRYSKKVKNSEHLTLFRFYVTVISFKLIMVTPMQKAYEKPVKWNEVVLN